MTSARNVDALLDEAAIKVRSEPQAVADLLHVVINDETVRPSSRARALLISARALLQLGRYEDGERIAREAESVARSAGLRIEEALALNEVGVFRFVRADRASALNYYDAARDLLLRYHATADLARVYVNIGNVHQLNADHFYAISAYETAAELARSSGDMLTQAKVHSNLGSLYQYILFDDKGAEEHYTKAIELYRAQNDTLGVAKTLTHRGNGLRIRGMLEEAVESFKESIQMRGQVNEPSELAMSYYGLISCLASLHRTEEAEEAYHAVSASVGQHRDDIQVGFFLEVSRARILHLQGRTAEAIDLLDDVQGRVTADKGPVDAEIEEIRARFLHALGRHDEAHAILTSLLNRIKRRNAERSTEQIMHVKRHVEQVQLDFQQEIEHRLSVANNRSQQLIDAVRQENDDYVTYLSHELKSPLDSIRSIAEMLQHEPGIPISERMEYNKEIHAVAMRLLELINTTLDASRDRHTTKLSSVNVTTIINHLLNVAETRCEEKGITLVREVAPSELPVMATEQLVVTIVENLLSNAMKFSQSGSSIVVETRRLMGNDAVSRLLLSVKDEGPGVSEEDQKRLFKPFQRLSAQPSGSEASHGIGLHLVKRAVDTIGGRIWVESGMEKGATFFVELPMTLHER